MILNSEIAQFLPDNDYDGSITSLPGLKSFIGSSDPFMDYIKAIKMDMPRGVDIIGILMTRRRVILDMLGLHQMADWMLMHPEQRRFTLGEQTTGTGRRVHFSNPIAYDIYYLYYAGNVLLDGMHTDYTEDEWIALMVGSQGSISDDNRMYDYFHGIDPSDTLKPLKQPLRSENVDTEQSWGIGKGFSGTWGMNTKMVVNSSIKDAWRYAVKEARFEILTKEGGGLCQAAPGFTLNKMPTWGSDIGEYDSTVNPPVPLFGPKEPDGDAYCGFVAFPVGQLGAMWKMSMVTHSPIVEAGSGVYPYSSGTGLRASGANVHPVDAETTIEQGGELLPPFTMATSEVPGELLVEKGWLVANKGVVEYPAKPFSGIENWPLHYWLRYWITAGNTEIVPGEFVGLLCKPWPLHCWFYQESSPLLYAGNWMETEFYTSGIIKEVLEPWTSDDPMPSSGYYDPDEQVGTAQSNHYRIWIKGEEMIVESSDWKEYEEGERVGLLKRVRDTDGYSNSMGPVTDTSGGDNFDWQGLEYKKLKGKNTSDDEIYTRDWVIVPVWFFPDANTYPSHMSGS